MGPADYRSKKMFMILSGLAGLLLLLASCLKDKPESFPEEIVWNPELAFPLGSDTLGMNEESGFNMTLFDLDTLFPYLPRWIDEAEIPLDGSIEFDLASLNASTEEINRILFRFSILNGFPNDLLAQGYFLGQDSIRIDSMFEGGPVAIPPGKVRGSGETIEPARVTQDALFGRDRIGPLEDASMIQFRTTIVNPEIDTTLIPFYPDYTIDVEIGAMLDLTLHY
jgi:hypothetical protein